jgi:hypothetical protein
LSREGDFIKNLVRGEGGMVGGSWIVKSQKSKVKSQKSKVKSQKSKVKSQKSKVKSQKSKKISIKGKLSCIIKFHLMWSSKKRPAIQD